MKASSPASRHSPTPAFFRCRRAAAQKPSSRIGCPAGCPGVRDARDERHRGNDLRCRWARATQARWPACAAWSLTPPGGKLWGTARAACGAAPRALDYLCRWDVASGAYLGRRCDSRRPGASPMVIHRRFGRPHPGAENDHSDMNQALGKSDDGVATGRRCGASTSGGSRGSQGDVRGVSQGAGLGSGGSKRSRKPCRAARQYGRNSARTSAARSQ